MMWFRLAEELGYTVRRLKSEMTWSEFMCWVAYFDATSSPTRHGKRRAMRANTKESVSDMLRSFAIAHNESLKHG